MITLRPEHGASPSVELVALDTASAAVLGRELARIDPWHHYRFSGEALAKYLSAADTDADKHALLIGGELAGAVIVRIGWLRGPYLQFLGILPKFQRQGVGRLVMAWMESLAQQRAETNLWVVTSSFNGHALSFYGRNGFRPVAVLDGLIATGIDEILLRKTIASSRA